MGAFAFSTGGGGGGGGGSPGGSSPQIQFNSSGSFGGTTNLEFDSANAALRGLTGLTGGIRLFNTVDVTTNTEFGSLSFATNVLTLQTNAAGTGTFRDIQIIARGSAGGSSTLQLSRMNTPFFAFSHITTSLAASLSRFSLLMNGSSGVATGLEVNVGVSQTATAGYNGLLIAGTETTTGSGTKNLLLGQIGGVNRFRVSNTGDIVISSAATGGSSDYNTSDEVTNFERNQQFWSGNVFNIQNNSGGTGVARELRLGNTSNFLRIFAPTGATQFEIQGSSTSVVATSGLFRSASTSTSSSGTHIFNQFAGVVNQSGTAGYTGFQIALTETATGSGGKQALQVTLGGAVQFEIGNTGRLRHIAANTSTTVGATGAAAALPANPLGYLIMEAAGVPVKIPYYNN